MKENNGTKITKENVFDKFKEAFETLETNDKNSVHLTYQEIKTLNKIRLPYPSKAREMFEKLGYERTLNEHAIEYTYDEEGSIRKVYFSFHSNDVSCYYYPDGEAFRISSDLLKAINKQMEELE